MCSSDLSGFVDRRAGRIRTLTVADANILGKQSYIASVTPNTTNNGDLVNKILRAGNNHEKEYVVTVDKPITDDFIAGMGAGVPMLGTVTKKCKVVKESTFVFRITLVQGLNRQIRLMAAHFGYRVKTLVRVRIGSVQLGHLKPGRWRNLTDAELRALVPGRSEW